MFCDPLFVYPADRDYYMCYEYENEVMPIVRCSEYSDTFECIHDKECHVCIAEPDSIAEPDYC